MIAMSFSGFVSMLMMKRKINENEVTANPMNIKLSQSPTTTIDGLIDATIVTSRHVYFDCALAATGINSYG